jgi:hypothetical protein
MRAKRGESTSAGIFGAAGGFGASTGGASTSVTGGGGAMAQPLSPASIKATTTASHQTTKLRKAVCGLIECHYKANCRLIKETFDQPSALMISGRSRNICQIFKDNFIFDVLLRFPHNLRRLRKFLEGEGGRPQAPRPPIKDYLPESQFIQLDGFG